MIKYLNCSSGKAEVAEQKTTTTQGETERRRVQPAALKLHEHLRKEQERIFTSVGRLIKMNLNLKCVHGKRATARH